MGKKESQHGIGVSYKTQRSWRPWISFNETGEFNFPNKFGQEGVDKDNLWSRVLRAKYCSGRCDIDMFTPKTNASNAWKRILKCAKFLKEGTKTKIAYGKKTLFWFHTWATKRPLCCDTLSSIPPELENLSLAEL